MMNARFTHLTRILLVLTGAILVVAALVTVVGQWGRTVRAGPPRSPGTGTDPEIRWITMTSDLPYHDPADGEGITKTVYFSNCVAGTITMTFDITGTPTLVLIAGGAFGDPAQVFTSTTSPFTPIVTYSVGVGDGDQQGIAYTVISTGTVQTTTVAITYVQDITAPTSSISYPMAGQYVSATQLVIAGTASDVITDVAGSGLQVVQVSTSTAWVDAAGKETWAYTWTLPITDGMPYTLSVRAQDNLDTWQQTLHSVPITVDNVPPTGTVVFTPSLPVCQWVNTNTFNVQWDGFTDNGGIAGYQYLISDTAPLTLPLPGGTFTTTTGVTEMLADGEWHFHLAARDEAGNWSTTRYTGLFHVDVTSPTVVISAPMSGAVLTTVLSSIPITGTASDATSDITQVLATTGTTWVPADGLAPWVYTWTLPIADNVVHTLTAQATDDATNVGISDHVTVTVDTIAPTATAPLPDRSPWVTSTVVYTWPASTDGAGIVDYRVNITNTEGYTGLFSTVDPALTFTQALTQGAGYYARVRASDTNGNVGAWSGPSAVVTPDLTAPNIWSPSVVEASDHLYAVGTHLYYTNTMPLAQTFAVRGHSSDGLSGVDRVSFSPAFGESPADDTLGFTPWQSGSPNYEVDPGATASGFITATVYDKAGNTAVQTYTYALDGTPPESTASAPAYATSSPIPVTWVATDTQSGVYSTTLWYMKEVTGTWTPTLTINAGSGTFNFYPPDADGLYLFATIAADNLQNLEAGPTVSETQTVYDTKVPQSEVTWAPQYRNTSPITMTWVATPSLGPLTEVRLWYRFDGGTWTTTTITRAASSGVFTFTRATDGSDDGTYGFATVAKDAFGKSEAEPPVIADETTVYDTIISPTIGLTGTPAVWTNTNAFTVTWDNPVDLSGIVGAYYKLDTAPRGPHDGTWVAGADLEQITGIAVTGEGTHTIYVWLRDAAGNLNHTHRRTTTLRYDGTPPTSVIITAPKHISATQFLVSWSAEDGTSGIASYTVEYSGTAYTAWQKWLTNTTKLSDTFPVPETETDYVFRVTAYDRAGNSAQDETATHVGISRVYIPMVVRNYVNIPFQNGSFEDGWSPWEHRGELAQERVTGPAEGIHDGHYAARFGDPTYNNRGGVPVGSARIWQEFSVPDEGTPTVTIWYHIYTHDLVWGPTTLRYYDSFEIYINTVDWDDAKDPDPADPRRKARCRDNLGVPDTSQAGLVFCDGKLEDSTGTGPPADLGWHSVTLDLSAFKGEVITLYIATFNRVDGWFNTWTYVDDITVSWQ